MPLRRWLFLVLIVAALLILQGCWVYSVYPLAETESDLVFDRNLLGTWQQQEECLLTLTRLGEEKNYRVTYASPRGTKGNGCLLKPGQSAGFVASVVEVNGIRFLDLYPADREPVHHVAYLHSFYKMTLRGQTLTLMPMNIEWITEQMNSGSITLTARPQNAEKDGDLILTSSTRELRSFLERNASDDQLFPTAQQIVLQRKPRL